MKAIRSLGLLCLFVGVAGWTEEARAGGHPPPVVNYQGVLRTSSGAPVNVPVNMVLRLYSASSGGDEILRDLHTSFAGQQVMVTGGLFNVLIGSGILEDGDGPEIYGNLRQVFQSYSDVYLEVQVELERLTPRTRIASAPYSFAGPRGVTFIRWGKETCPAGTERVYKGYPASAHSTTSGGISSQLCMASEPTWDLVVNGDQSGASLFGTEIAEVGGHPVITAGANENPYCAVCFQPDADAAFMYPGSQSCPTGWHTEYAGYIMGNLTTNAGPREAVCMDREPDFILAGGGDQDENIWYMTEAQCGSLPCPPYVDSHEVTCSVCSR